ncbi:protein ABIL1 [Tripterygium wilfordii]|uniref:Protein ABIL1 n=1 Tax=Tripterygium wilfordii TaxID=458696 RepID=A0A7J7CGB5_TRIWF|nr:protein ABIL1-like [Tripterygium wilfordii]KAF5733092.1 protein ABIL1 [Tripterygium wilfordii]
MEVEQSRTDYPATTFDEVSMERSKSFVKALQELKNLRPQLYSAAEYCEKSYLRSEQKQMVLDNLKDYAVRALVNAVDHLGTVAYKLTDLLEKQMLDSSTMELKVSCLNQQLLTCQTYTRQEGLRQQQLLAIIPRHHKHYILPNSVRKKVHFSPLVQTDPRQNHFQGISHFQPSGSPASKTLSWHMASETKSTTLKGTSEALTSNEEPKSYGKTSGVFNLLDNEVNTWTKSSVAPVLLASGGPAVMQTFGVTHRDQLEGTKPLTAFRSFDKPRRERVRAPVRSKSVLSAFFVKQKTAKMKATYVS